VCERMHQTVGNVLRTLLHGNPPQNIANAVWCGARQCQAKSLNLLPF
jgi:hypothetical protein